MIVEITTKTLWQYVVRDMKKKKSVNQIIYELGHDESFLTSMGYDYTNPDFKKLKKEIEAIE